MSDPDARRSEPPAPPVPGPGPARAVDGGELVLRAAEKLSQPLEELVTAVRAVHDHLDSDPEKAKAELERARAALAALEQELGRRAR